jgi:hypothetical protein
MIARYPRVSVEAFCKQCRLTMRLRADDLDEARVSLRLIVQAHVEHAHQQPKVHQS